MIPLGQESGVHLTALVKLVSSDATGKLVRVRGCMRSTQADEGQRHDLLWPFGTCSASTVVEHRDVMVGRLMGGQHARWMGPACQKRAMVSGLCPPSACHPGCHSALRLGGLPWCQFTFCRGFPTMSLLVVQDLPGGGGGGGVSVPVGTFPGCHILLLPHHPGHVTSRLQKLATRSECIMRRFFLQTLR